MERRNFGRRSTQLVGWIKVPGRRVQPCKVENLTVSGALLSCDDPRALPFVLALVIETTGFQSLCEARHCSDRTIGVAFVERPRPSPSSPRPAGNDVSAWVGGGRDR